MNSTSLSLVRGLNSFILKPFLVESNDCFAAVRTDDAAKLYTRNLMQDTAGFLNIFCDFSKFG
jgi:hypothetical protein